MQKHFFLKMAFESIFFFEKHGFYQPRSNLNMFCSIFMV